jgi:hypothetical protein
VHLLSLTTKGVDKVSGNTQKTTCVDVEIILVKASS